ncbi:MAG: HipA domain-containing protein [Lactimicrobium sp.]|jgi:serine/threonine-protein kinase HipA|uniref:type II toxin-antitoxin system HipA family toxin n=1 Tax=Lactimicrobium sp. TaxID=2563780 RepID=UPI002F35298B
MKRCLCCGKPLSAQEESIGWHKRCINKFFDTDELPSLQINHDEMKKLADLSVEHHQTIAGVQKKLSLHLSKLSQNRLTLVDYPTGYILKPPSDEYALLPETEQLVMTMADRIGIRTVPHALIRLQNEQFGYITKRIDRRNTADSDSFQMYAMEDFCQLMQRQTADKYSSSYEQCGQVIWKYSSQPGLDLADFFLRILFCFVTLNSDMHLKNFSLIEKKPGNRIFTLSPAYDLLPVNLVVSSDKEQTALTLNGKKKNLHRKDFLILAQHCGINQKAAVNMIQEIILKKDIFMKTVDECSLPDEVKVSLKEMMADRISALSAGKQN